MVLARGKINYNVYVQTLYKAVNIISIKYLPLCKRYISHHEFNIDDYEKLREWQRMVWYQNSLPDIFMVQ